MPEEASKSPPITPDDLERLRAEAERSREESERLRALADALARDGLEKEMRVRAAEAANIVVPFARRKLGQLVVVPAAPPGEEGVRQAKRSANPDAVAEAAQREAKAAHGGPGAGIRREAGAATRVAVESAYEQVRDEWKDAHGGDLPGWGDEKTIDRRVLKRLREVGYEARKGKKISLPTVRGYKPKLPRISSK